MKCWIVLTVFALLATASTHAATFRGEIATAPALSTSIPFPVAQGNAEIQVFGSTPADWPATALPIMVARSCWWSRTTFYRLD